MCPLFAQAALGRGAHQEKGLGLLVSGQSRSYAGQHGAREKGVLRNKSLDSSRKSHLNQANMYLFFFFHWVCEQGKKEIPQDGRGALCFFPVDVRCTYGGVGRNGAGTWRALGSP